MPSSLPILAIVGVTGSGKNELAQDVARRTGASLISVDSRKVYRGMDIGTAKPSPDAIREFDYGMIDCADPREYFSAARFASEARAIVAQRVAVGKSVILVGGTGFYLDAFMNGLVELPEVTDEWRRAIDYEIEVKSWDALYKFACEVDPVFMSGVVPGDKTRIRRVLETWYISHERLSDRLDGQYRRPCPWEVRVVWQDVEREVAIDRIDKRVARMRDAGLTEEVRRLLDSGIPRSAPSLMTIGYSQLVRFLTSGMGTEETAYSEIMINTRQYAKRQATWFRHRPYVHRIAEYPVAVEEIIRLWSHPIWPPK